MFFTLAIRLLTSFLLAIGQSFVARSGLDGRRLRDRVGLLLGVLGVVDRLRQLVHGTAPVRTDAGGGGVERLALLVEVGTEVLEELADRLAQLVLVLVGQVAGVANTAQQLVLLGVHVRAQVL